MDHPDELATLIGMHGDCRRKSLRMGIYLKETLLSPTSDGILRVSYQQGSNQLRSKPIYGADNGTSAGTRRK
jgi:hypothetical protein